MPTETKKAESTNAQGVGDQRIVPGLSERIENALDGLHGPRETYRPMLDAVEIMDRICRTAEGQAFRRGCEPWVIISYITGHDCGVSSTIYKVYASGQSDNAAS